MKHTTPMITEALRAFGDADGIKLLYLAADRLEELQRELQEALELAKAAADTSPYPQTPHFWKRLHELKNGTNNSN